MINFPGMKRKRKKRVCAFPREFLFVLFVALVAVIFFCFMPCFK